MKLVYKHNPLHSYFEPQTEYDLKIIEQVIRLEKITEIYDQPDAETEITHIINLEVDKKEVDDIVQMLKMPHEGDCISVSMTCPKCYAESQFDISSISMFTSVELRHIDMFFRQDNVNSIDDLIEEVKWYRPQFDLNLYPASWSLSKRLEQFRKNSDVSKLEQKLLDYKRNL